MIALLVLVGCQSTPMTLEQHISRHAKSTNGNEYLLARIYAQGDIDGDGKDDAAVIYTLEGIRGGNDWLQFLAVKFSSANGRIIWKQAGGKDIRAVENIKITNEKIVASTLEYGPSDDSCYPSVSKTAIFVIRNGKLIEVGK